MQRRQKKARPKKFRKRVLLSVACLAALLAATSSPSPIPTALAQDTGPSLPTTSGALRSEWATAEHAYAEDGQYAKGYAYDASGDGDNNDEQSFEGFRLQVAEGATIDGISVHIKAYSDDDGEDCDLDVKLFWRTDGGWTDFSTAFKTWWNIENDAGVRTLGGPADTWGRESWNPGDFTDDNFAVGLRSAPSSGCGYGDHVFVDYVAVTVYYDAPPIDALTPRTSNPPLVRGGCNKADFSLVIDRSASMAGYESEMVNKISAFVDTFEAAGGDGRYSATTFSEDEGRALTLGYVSPVELESALSGLPANEGRTPIAAGIMEALDNGSNDRSDAPNIMLVISDGSPNVPPSPSEYNPDLSDTWLTGANAAIEAANSARSAGFVVRGVFEGRINEALPWTAESNQEWVDAVMNHIDGSASGYIEGDYSALALNLMSELGCRSIRVRKEAIGADAPAGTFQGTISNTDGFGQEEAWSIQSPDPGWKDFVVPLDASHMVVELLPLEPGWTLVGYMVQTGLNGCPNSGYSGSSASVSAGRDDATVCVQNSYDACAVAETHVNGPSGACLDTFVYRVCQSGPAALSHWTLALPACTTELSSTISSIDYQLGDSWNVAASCSEAGSQDDVCYDWGADNECNIPCGLTWHLLDPGLAGVTDGECILLSVAFDHQVETQVLEWRARAGDCDCAGVGETVIGPSSDPCCATPQADFSATPTSGCAPLAVSFSDESLEAASWSWDFGDGSMSTEQHPSHGYAAAGSYTVSLTVKNYCGEDTETKVDLIAVSDPRVTASPASAELNCKNETVLLTATISGGEAPISLQWYRDGVAIGGATWSTFEATAPGEYIAMISDANGCTAASNAVTITRVDDPEVIVSPASGELHCNNETVALTATVSGAKLPVSLQWYRDGVAIAGATSSSFEATIPGEYVVAVSDTNDCTATSNAVTITQVDDPEVIVSPAAGELHCNHETVALTATVSGGKLPVSLQWYRDGAGIASATSPIFEATAPGEYVVTVSDANGCTAISNAVTITRVDDPEVIASPAAGELNCKNALIALAATVSGGKLPVSLQWYRDGVAITGATSSTFEATIPGEYVVPVSDANGCTAISNAVTVTWVEDPEVIVSPAAGELNCNGETVTLTATVCGGKIPISLQWYRDGAAITGASSSTLEATVPGKYVVTASDANGCTATSNAASITRVDDPRATVCDIEACDDELPVTMSVATDAAAPTYTWTAFPEGFSDPGPVPAFETTVAGKYCAEVTDGDTGCTGTDCGTLTIHQAPTILDHPVDCRVCEGDPATFSVAAVGTNLSYQWEVKDLVQWQVIPEANDAFYTISPAAFQDDGKAYRTVVTAASCGSATSNPAILEVIGRPVATAPEVHLCNGYSPVDLQAAIVAAGAGCSRGTASISDNENGGYTVQCSNECGTDEAVGSISMKPSPRVSVDSRTVRELPATLTADTSDSECPVADFQWYTGTSVSAGLPIPEAVERTLEVSTAGDYTVHVRCDNGCAAEATSTVTLLPINEQTLEVTKEASTGFAYVGSMVTYTYSITNIGNETLTGITAYDDKLGSVELKRTVLGPGERASGRAGHTVDVHDYPGPIVNTVVVSASTSASGVVTGTATARVETALVPELRLCRVHLPFVAREATPSAESASMPYLPVLIKPAPGGG